MTDETKPEAPEGGMAKIRERHAEAVERFGHHYKPRGMFGLPHLEIGVQGFALHSDPDEKYGDEHREWYGIMLCAALKTLVEEHTTRRVLELTEAIKEAEQTLEALLANLESSEDVANEVWIEVDHKTVDAAFSTLAALKETRDD